MDFISFNIIDIIDILLVAFLMYQIYLLIRGTVAINIFIGIFIVYVVYLFVRAMNLSLLSTILRQFIGVGMIALIIVFQQELRRFLLLIGTRYHITGKFSMDQWFSAESFRSKDNIDTLMKACEKLSSSKTGGLIVIQHRTELSDYIMTGETVNSDMSAYLLESIFSKTSPLHDGAVIIVGNKIKAAGCILPVSEKTDLPPEFGFRHRAALGMAEATDAYIIVVSEETGTISLAQNHEINNVMEISMLSKLLAKNP